MKILFRFITFGMLITFIVTGITGQILVPVNTVKYSKTGSTAVQSAVISPWAEEISTNGALAAVVSVPPVIRVANADYGLDNQALTASDCSTIQTQVINYSTRSMQTYSTVISVSVPAGASAPSLSAATQGAGIINIAPVSQSGNPYTWQITGGSAVAGNYIHYTIIYNLNGRQYVQKAASYVDLVELGAGWQTYVVRRNWIGTIQTRHEYTSVLSGSGSSGLGYAVYGGGGTGYYKMATGGGSTGFVSGSTGYSGMRLWDPGVDGKENVEHWYCGQSGNASEENGDGGYRATLDVYYDPAIITNISQLGIKLLYWRSTTPEKMPTIYQEKMIYLAGSSLFSSGSSSNTTAQTYFYSTNALNTRTQGISTNPGTMTFSFGSTALPPDGQKITFASGVYGKENDDLTTWDAWLVTFHVVNKSALRSLLATEDTAFRQIHDGYTDTDGSFTAYLNQLAKSKAVLNQPNASSSQIAAAVSDLNAAKANFKYLNADYAALNNLVDNVYNVSAGFRPSPINDPDYYYAGVTYYPSAFYHNTTELQTALSSAVYGLDIRYQAYVNTVLAEINTAWRSIELLNADYSIINAYLSKIEGINDMTGSPAGNYILANASVYPQYEGDMLYWRNFFQSGYDDWENAVNSVTLGLKIPDQNRVYAMAAAMQTAYESMALKPADYTELNAVRIEALTAVNRTVPVQNPEGGGYDRIFYSAASVQTIQAKLNEIIDGLLMPEQAAVIFWTDELNALLDTKTLNNADYSYADFQRSVPVTYESEAAAFYTAVSWQALATARGAVLPGKLADEQDTVNTWAVNIYNARNALVFNTANYAAVDAAVAAANELNPAIYQNWSAVQAAMDAVVYGLDITNQSVITVYAADINAAVSALVIAAADLTALNEALSAASLLNQGIYTPESWSVLAAAVSAGVAMRDSNPAYNITQQTDVDLAAAAVVSAAEGLIEAEVSFMANPGSTAVIDSARGYIYGLPASGNLYDLTAQGYVELTGSGHFDYTPTALGFGTGTKAELVRDADGKVMATYYVIIFGDTDGDGYADGRDACLAGMLAAGMLTQNDIGDAAYFAADANHDSSVNSLDALLLEQAGLFLAEVNQNPG